MAPALVDLVRQLESSSDEDLGEAAGLPVEVFRVIRFGLQQLGVGGEDPGWEGFSPPNPERWRRLLAGEVMQEIARDEGVSVAAVSNTWKKYARPRDELIRALRQLGDVTGELV